MSTEMILLVDDNDCPAGYGEKMEAHQVGRLHRAFSVFAMSAAGQHVLLQKRAAAKYHFGGLWSNACCSHPLQGEADWQPSLSRCLAQELGIAPVFEVSHDAAPFPRADDVIYHTEAFRYTANDGHLYEHEIDHVFLYLLSDELASRLAPNPDEIDELRWIPRAELAAWLQNSPQDFSPWFPYVYEQACRYYDTHILS